MEQFKKWSKLSQSNSLEESIAEENAWRAALEWIRDKIDSGCDFSSLGIVNIIDEELGNDKES